MKAEAFCQALRAAGFACATGVPDSIFKDLIDAFPASGIRHVIATEEGEACAVATGYHLATGQAAVVYMQNSGLGNAVNPLTSLLDPLVYGIPVLLLVSWRGRPGEKDEPQHVRMGEITPRMIEVLEVPSRILEDDERALEASLEAAKAHFAARCGPFALVVPRGVLGAGKEGAGESPALTREEVVGMVAERLPAGGVIVATTGKASRELFEHRVRNGQGHERDFLTVGSMGYCSGIALGIAQANENRKVVVLDGDGALLMRMGSLATVGHYRPANLWHIVLDNRAYESTGGQRTVSETVRFEAAALGCGYRQARRIEERRALAEALEFVGEGPALLSVRVACSSRPDLGRPTTTPQENKRRFMAFLAGSR